MILKKLLRALVCAGACAMAATSASAAAVAWTDWTSIGGTSATGTMNGVSVSVSSAVALDGVSQTGCGTNYWTQPNPAVPAYTGGTVSNAPTDCEQVGLNSPNRVTVTFGSAVDTLYMALLSIGQFGLPVTYDFDQSFVVDSNGVGYWSGGVTGGYSLGAGDVITMEEMHGVLRFSAPVTSLTFSTAPAEYWHAFTFGTTNGVPEPGSLALTGGALLSLVWLRRRRDRR